MGDIFWLDNYYILLNKWLEFIPSNEYEFKRNINAIVRFLIYSIGLVYIYGGNRNILLFLIILLILVNLIGMVKFSKQKIYDNTLTRYDKKETICRKSTVDNPMSNILITMTPQELDIKACDEKINTDKLVNNNLSYNTYTNVDDFYNTKNGNIGYVQLPSTSYPGNFDDFKSFLYNLDKNNCKVNGSNCMGWYDVKYE